MRRIACLIVMLVLTASRSSAPTAPPTPPFKLTGEEEQKVDRLLARWEQWNAGLKTFDCRFKRWTYDTVFGRPDEAAFVELGTIKYAAPDHGLFRVDTADENGKEVAIEPRRAEHWAFDGKSVFEVNSVKRQVIEHRRPRELQGSRLVDGPLSFLFPIGQLYCLTDAAEPNHPPIPFGAKARDIKRQYYLRTITPADRRQDEIWLEAYPRSSGFACWYQKFQLKLIFSAKDMSPVAIQIVQPCGRGDYAVYRFYDISLNALPTPPGDDPFHPAVPYGWQKIVE